MPRGIPGSREYDNSEYQKRYQIANPPIYIDRAIGEWIDIQARIERRTKKGMVEFVLEQYLKKNKTPKPKRR